MEEVLRQTLLQKAALVAAVNNRIDWGIRANADLPAVRLLEINGLPQMNLSGPSGWTRSRIQIEAWGRTYKVARDIADLIGGEQGVLNGLRTTAGGIRLRTFILGRRADQDTDSVGVLHRSALDVLVWHATD